MAYLQNSKPKDFYRSQRNLLLGMGIYDNLVFEETPRSLADLPFDASVQQGLVDGDTQTRLWQTKDLNPSMDCYGVRRGESGRFGLYRRHPPLIRWTDQNEGVTDENSGVFTGADHWRRVGFSGELRGTTLLGNVIFEIEASVNDGVFHSFDLRKPSTMEVLAENNTVLLVTGASYERQHCLWDDSRPSSDGVLCFMSPENYHQQVFLSLRNIDALRDSLIKFDADSSQEHHLAPSERVTYATAQQSHTCLVCGEDIKAGTQFLRLENVSDKKRQEIVLGFHAGCKSEIASMCGEVWNQYSNELLADSL